MRWQISRHRYRPAVSIIAVVVILAAGFANPAAPSGTTALVRVLGALVPDVLGGSATYLRVHGTSMEPLLYSGDLIAVRSSPRYSAGDIIAYTSPGETRIIVHRVIAATNRPGSYLVKGDGNRFVDRFRPTVGHIIGRSILIIPLSGVLRRLVDHHHPLISCPLACHRLVSDSRRADHGERRTIGAAGHHHERRTHVSQPAVEF